MEDFGYQKNNESTKFPLLIKRICLMVAAIMSFATFMYITINAYYFIYHDKNADIKIIKSPKGPIKIIKKDQIQNPKNSIQINHSIYEDIFGNKKEELAIKKAKVRHIPKTPLPPKASEQTIQKNIPEAKSQNEKIIIYSEHDIKAKPSQNLLTNLKKEKRDNTATTTPKILNKRRIVRVQVAAMASFRAAKENWKRLSRLYPNLFSGLNPLIKKVDLGKRGIFYRLQIGNFYDQVDAEKFCNNYITQTNKNRADCIIVE